MGQVQPTTCFIVHEGVFWRMATIPGTSSGAAHRLTRATLRSQRTGTSLESTADTPSAESVPASVDDETQESRESAESRSPKHEIEMETRQRRPSVTDVWQAQELIRPHISHTTILASRTLSAMTGARIFLKAENLQRSGAYKIRGATYKLSRLTEKERKRGVITASAGTHGQGVAIAASALHVPCTVVMPTGAPLAKVTATQGYGATTVLHGDTYNEAYDH